MEASVLFLSCPAYLDERGTVRCGLLAEVEEVYSLPSTEGPVESARIRCPAGHYFNGPVEAFRTASSASGGEQGAEFVRRQLYPRADLVPSQHDKGDHAHGAGQAGQPGHRGRDA
jgi:hypothetical protein